MKIKLMANVKITKSNFVAIMMKFSLAVKTGLAITVATYLPELEIGN